MSTNKENSIGIHYFGVQDKDRATFDRVVAFNVTHGLDVHESSEITSADLIIVPEASYPDVSSNDKATTLVITKDESLGNVQVASPLLITRVMKALEAAIKLVDKKPAADVSTEEPVIDTSQSGHHALVIDDSAAIRKQLELELRDAGIKADFAESGEEALEKIKTTQYDLVFLDIIMPGIDGYETCKAMRATEEYKKTPIIMLSGKTSPLDEVQGVIAGATTYLTKPVKSAMLQETLNRVTKWIENYAASQKEKDSATV